MRRSLKYGMFYIPIHANGVLIARSLDSEVIVLRGVENEAASQLLKGVVVLCLPSALKVEDVHLRMTGHLRIG